MPVTKLDGRRIGDGRPGRIARAIHDLYWRRHEEGWKATEVDYGATAEV
jgi:branched-chain amino acid aminotransferase